jgi:putative Mg2+ transporter-C (MgtC) family protein
MESWLEQIDTWVRLETVLRLVVAIIAAAVVGWERESRNKPAGLRTHILVSLGAATFMIGALELSVDMGHENPAIRLDPMRALAGIIGGVGFLGAGTIIQSRGSVQGITTAASIWVSAALGTCCGMGLYRLALTCGVFALVVLWAVGFFENFVFRNKNVPKE